MPAGDGTGPMGMGHAVLHVKDAELLLPFYRDLLDYRVVDDGRLPESLAAVWSTPLRTAQLLERLPPSEGRVVRIDRDAAEAWHMDPDLQDIHALRREFSEVDWHGFRRWAQSQKWELD